MTPSCPSALPRLSEEELAQIRGGGGEISVAIQNPPFRATVGCTFEGPRGSLTGLVTKTDRGLEGGLALRTRLGRASLEGALRAEVGGAWSGQATLRIPVGP